MLDSYCWPQSGSTGDVIDVAISSSDPECSVVVVRVGTEEKTVTATQLSDVAEQPVPDDVAINGCGWSTSLAVTIDDTWDSGFYLIRLTNRSGDTAEAFFVITADEAARARRPADAILVLATSTYAAYNDWGGPSFYTGGHVSSMQRPLPRGFLDKPDPHRYRIAKTLQLPRHEVKEHFRQYSYWSSASGWANWEKLFVQWAEANDVALDFATSLDLAHRPDLLEPYDQYISVGHDEYWSAAMRDQVEGWAYDGGSAAFFSGNTAFWQVRFEGDTGSGPTQVVGYKNDFELDPVMGTDDEHTVSTMWSDPLCGRPENEMTGVSFTRGGYAHCLSAPVGSGGYTVWQPDHWVFDGVDIRVGDIVGAEPVVVGYECDGCELQLVDGLPKATGAGGTPSNFEVLGTAPAHLWETSEAPPGLAPAFYIGELNWVTERLGGGDTPENRKRFTNGRAVMGAYDRGKGHVFTSGCTDWAYGLGDEVISRITRNVLASNLAPGKDAISSLPGARTR